MPAATPARQADAAELARAAIHALLARLFAAPPDPALLRRIASDAGGEEQAPIDAPPSAVAFAQAWSRLAQACSVMDAAAAAAEFDALFCLPSTEGGAHPWASWHRHAGELSGRTLVALRSDLARLGIGRRAGVHEPEDHIAFLCDAMRLLAEGGVPWLDTEGALAEQRRLLASHLAPWYRAFADELDAVPAANFYRVVGRVMRAFLDLECQGFDLEVPVGRPDPMR